MKKSLFVVLLIIIFSIGYFMGNRSTGTPDNVISQTQQVSEKAEQTKPLGALHEIVTPKGKIYISVYNDYISFNPYETAINNATSITLSKEKYPKLFEQGIGNHSHISISGKEDKVSGKFYVQIANEYPDRGGYLPLFSLNIDPFSGKVEETPTNN